jgi:hypothetical protein
MATQRQPLAELHPPKWGLQHIASFSNLRALAWDGDVLYASRGYSLLRAKAGVGMQWQSVGRYRPELWRNLSSSFRLSSRLFRDGYHALAVMPTGHLCAAVPGAIISLSPDETEFRVSHRISRGTRPLHMATAPNGHLFWGEYFDNPSREEVHIFASADSGATWNVTYTFPRGTVRHVHNVVYDPWENCLWVLTGDNGSECRILRASFDFRSVDTVMSGNQQARAVAIVPTKGALYFSSDTPLEQNHIYRLDRRGNLSKQADVTSSSIYGCRVGEAVFFSTMIEPSSVNLDRRARLYGSSAGREWSSLLNWHKDVWPMGFFQYGNIFLPDGKNTSGILALSTVAVKGADLETSLWSLIQP